MSETLKPGTILNNRYEIVSVLGKGGMSNVYLVQDKKLHSRWALKEMLDVFPDEDKTSILEQFRKEARILAGLKHPNLPRVFDYFEEKSRHYLVMEYIEGLSLKEIFEKNPKIDPKKIVRWSIQLLDVLDSLHAEGIIYRDLKPANVMVDRENQVYLVDFGIARLFSGGKIHDTIIIGTPGFASPEHHGRAETDGRSDIYSLGATMYYLLTRIDPGLTPFVFKNPSRVDSTIPEKLSAAILKATAVDPEERFQSASEMKEYLQNEVLPALEKTAPQQKSKTPTTPPSSPDTMYTTESFSVDPVKSYLYPAVISAGALSSFTLLLTGGVLNPMVIAFTTAAFFPTTYLLRRLKNYVEKSPRPFNIKLSSYHLEIIRSGRTTSIPYESVTELLMFQEKTRIGSKINKYRIATRSGNFEYDDRIARVKQLNDMLITRARLTLKGESGEYRRYAKE